MGRVAAHGPGSKLYAGVLALLLSLSLLGLVVSFWVHVVAWTGADPTARVPALWTFQLLLFALVLPLAIEVVSTRDPARILQSPPWMRGAMYSLLVYYGLNFYLFLYWSVDHLSGSATWRMFSSGWLLLFGLTAVYYWVRFLECK